jgi:hypothetical protein
MANVIVVNTKSVLELAPGQEGHWHWNHAAPANAVWSANAVPASTGSTAQGFNQDTAVEITRMWRRLIVTEKKPFPQSQTTDLEVEHEIHYVAKNIGTQKASFVVWLSALS